MPANCANLSMVQSKLVKYEVIYLKSHSEAGFLQFYNMMSAYDSSKKVNIS